MPSPMKRSDLGPSTLAREPVAVTSHAARRADIAAAFLRRFPMTCRLRCKSRKVDGARCTLDRAFRRPLGLGRFGVCGDSRWAWAPLGPWQPGHKRDHGAGRDCGGGDPAIGLQWWVRRWTPASTVMAPRHTPLAMAQCDSVWMHACDIPPAFSGMQRAAASSEPHGVGSDDAEDDAHVVAGVWVGPGPLTLASSDSPTDRQGGLPPRRPTEA